MQEEVYQKIISKKEFKDLPKSDVEKVYAIFDKPEFLEEEKVKMTRDLLRKVYVAFSSSKILNPKIVEKKSTNEIMQKHLSTKERFEYFDEVYSLLFGDFNKVNVYDLGAGINGLSYYHIKDKVDKLNYVAMEAVGQKVDLMNAWFSKEKIRDAVAIKGTLFDFGFVKDILKKDAGKKVVFLFKALDSMEMVERNSSKELLKEIVPLVDRVVVSFATRSLVSKKKFHVKRVWFEKFIAEMGWKILEDTEIGNERYIVFCGR